MKALFLDRDGVINLDHGYVSRIEDFEFVPGVLTFIEAAQKRGYQPIVVTNQSGIGRGYYTLEDFETLTAHMLQKMREAGIAIGREHIFFCPHRPDEGCGCRKPEPGMFLAAKKRFGIEMGDSVMVGDKPSDIEAAKRAGVGRTRCIDKNGPIDWRWEEMTADVTVEKIREALVKKRVVWQKHALQRMLEREISRRRVRNALLCGEAIERYETDRPFPSLLVFDKMEKPIHIVVAYDETEDLCYVITAYHPDRKYFEADLKTRRR